MQNEIHNKNRVHIWNHWNKIENLPVSIDINAVTAKQSTIQIAVITTAISLIDWDKHQATLRGFNIFGGCVIDFITEIEENEKIEVGIKVKA